jgi:hypothetical protein
MFHTRISLNYHRRYINKWPAPLNKNLSLSLSLSLRHTRHNVNDTIMSSEL